jgi:hypothetical protein
MKKKEKLGKLKKKIILKKKTKKKRKKKGEEESLWITVVIHSEMCVGNSDAPI